MYNGPRKNKHAILQPKDQWELDPNGVCEGSNGQFSLHPTHMILCLEFQGMGSLSGHCFFIASKNQKTATQNAGLADLHQVKKSK